METFPVKQTKFSNGEIDPKMYGDVTHPKYASSLALCQNWIPIPQGALVKRPGFQFIAPVKDATYTPRLIKFVFSDGLSFVLEVGNLYARFYQRGKYVGNDGNLHTYGDAYGGGYYELVTPWTTAMLPFLKFSQVGNTVTVAYGGQASGVAAIAPRDLTHTTGALSPWVVGLTPLKIPIASVPFAPAVNINAWSNITNYRVGDFSSQNNVLWVSIQSNNLNNSPPAPALNASGTALVGTIWWMPAVDLAHTAVTVSWVETAVVQDPNGVTFETGPGAVTTGTGPLGLDRVVPLLTNSVVLTPALPVGWTLLYYKIYRAPANGIFGWIADIKVGSNFNDDGRAPDYTRQPPQGTDPFIVNAADSWPSVIGYLDQRRLWANLLLLPSSIFMSRIGDLYNYDSKNTPGADTDAMTLLLASEELEQVRSFVPMRRGLVFTSQSEWAVSGQGGSPISRSNHDEKRQSGWGSSWLNPIKIGTGVLFNTAKSNMVRDLYPLYGLYSDIWDGQDLSIMARHLLELNTLRDWDYQSTPYSVVWAVRDDGVLISLTYQHAPPSFGQQLAEGIVAWARHTTGVGSDAFEAVAVVPEPPEDAVYCVVKRTLPAVSVRNIERASNPICPASPYLSGKSDVRYGRYLDAWLAYDGHNDQIGFTGVNATIDSVAAPGSIDPANYAIGSQVRINIAGGPFVAQDAANPYGSGFVFDPEDLLGIAHAVDANGVALGVPKAHIVQYVSGAQVIAELDVPMSQAQVTAWRAGQSRWAVAKGQVTAAHLAGYQVDSNDANLLRGVICLADGDVQVPVWAAGVASLAVPAVVAVVGVAYNSDAQQLDAYTAQAEIRNRFKEVKRVGFEVAFTRDMWIGKDFTSLTQWEQRRVVDAYGVMQPQTGYFEVDALGEWNKSGQAAVRHFSPLPATITSVLREMRLGDS